MAALTWVGGGNNDANNPQDWNPAQAPAPGDTLTMPSGTMNISANNLAGDTLQIGSDQASPATPTNINLSNFAEASISQPVVAAGQSVVTNINSEGIDTLNLSSSTVNAPIGGTFNVDVKSGLLQTSLATQHSTVNINGNGILDNDASTFAATQAVIKTPVVGDGSFDVTALPGFMGIADPGSLEFGGFVSPSETTTVGHTIPSAPMAPTQDTVKIDQPTIFLGSVVMQPSAAVDLVGLGNADSYAIQDNKLQFISDNKVIDTLNLTNQASANLVVSTNGNDAYVTQQGLSTPPEGSKTLPQASAADFASNVAEAPAGWTGPTTDNSAAASSFGVPDSGNNLQLMHALRS